MSSDAFLCYKPSQQLALNGHIDVFPVGDAGGWTQDPWGAALVAAVFTDAAQAI